MALEIAHVIIFISGYFIIGVSLVPLIRNDNWVFRIFEYPRAQKLIINVILLIVFLFVAEWQTSHHVFFTCILSANALYLFYQVLPYTILSKHQMKRSDKICEGRNFKLLICNVYQDNRHVDKCLNCIRQHDPDIVILLETDAWWRSRLTPLEARYPYRVSRPLENTYGMLLYSRLVLVNPAIRYLVDDGVPSIRTRVELPAGDHFLLYCLHPQPPVPRENPRSTERDAELLTVAKEAKACHLPVIVAGDLNDVAWSYTTELFMKISGLLDPRRGRGFFNTFHAGCWYLRWPLDHVFCSKHFQLNDLKRLPPMGSDHFPILIGLALNEMEQDKNSRQELQADPKDHEVAEEKIARAR